MCPFRTDIRAVRRAGSFPFMMPHDSPSLMVHPCCSHFHFEHRRRHVSVSRRTPVVFECSFLQPLQFRAEMFQFFIRCHNFSFMVFLPKSVDSLRGYGANCVAHGPPEDNRSQASASHTSRRNVSPTPQLFASWTCRRCAAGRTDSTKSKHRLNETLDKQESPEFGASKMRQRLIRAAIVTDGQ